MSHLDTARNHLHARIVYWGPASSGKTVTLASLRRFLDPEDRLRLYSIAHDDGETFSFDLLPVEEFGFGSCRVRIRVIAVPGGAAAAGTRLTLMRDADAVVFVADASRDALEANLGSVRELGSALHTHGREISEVPTVWSFNKQDLAGTLPASALREQMAANHEPSYETVATDGQGVFESFSEVFRRLMVKLAERHDILDLPEADDPVPSRLLPQLARGPVPRRPQGGDDRHLVLRVPGGSLPRSAQALEAQLRVVEAHADVEAINGMLEGRNRELMAINRVARSILSAMEVDNLLVVLLDSTADYLRATHASCVVFDPGATGSLKTHVHGFGRDPVLGLPQPAARGFFQLMRDSDGPIPFQENRNPELLAALRRVDRRIRRAIFQPIKSSTGKLAGWLGIYSGKSDLPLNTQDLLFLSSISRLAALGLEKIGLLDGLQRSHAQLQEEVQDLNGTMEMANARIRALNRGIESRVAEKTRVLEEANRALKERSAGTAHAARLAGLADLAASFAHEVNNPLAGLHGNLEFMREGLDELRARVASGAGGLEAIQEFQDVIGECHQGAMRIAGIIASLRRFGGDEASKSRFSVNTAVADAVTLLEERAGACAEIELRLGTLPEVEGDALELSHVVLAVLTNAVEAVERSGERGTITVTSFADGGRVTLTVQDTGGGIQPDLLQRVFEPFVSTKEGEPSAGLGLHIAYQTVERQGGRMRVRSRPGRGTTVIIELAAAVAAETPRHETA